MLRFHKLIEGLRATHTSGPDRLYEIPWGGSSPLGSLGFVAAGVELGAQLSAAGLRAPVRVYLPCGTMGSIAGLLLGLRLASVPATVVSVKVVPQQVVNTGAVLALTTAVAAEMQRHYTAIPSLPEASASLEFRADFAGNGYALPTSECLEAVALARDMAGFKLDTTYSGKALACLIADARSGRLAGAIPIFWQTWNSRPYPSGLDNVDTGSLPAALRKFFP